MEKMLVDSRLLGGANLFCIMANDVKMPSTKTLPKMEISDDLDLQIKEGMKVSDLCKSDVIRQALHIGLPQFAACFQPRPLWLEERIREAVAEPADASSGRQFDEIIAAIANGN